MASPVKRANLRAQPQAVCRLQAEAHDDEIEVAVGKLQQRSGWIGLPGELELAPERLPNAPIEAVIVLDEQDPAAARNLVEA